MSKKELIKRLFEFPTLDIPVKKQIIVQMDKYEGRLGYGNVEIKKEGPNGFSTFKTLQENPFLYISERGEYVSGEYELIVKE